MKVLVLNRRLGVSDKVVLAYSGGLDSSVSIQWLKERYNLEVISSRENRLLVDPANTSEFAEAIIMLFL